MRKNESDIDGELMSKASKGNFNAQYFVGEVDGTQINKDWI